LNLLHYEHNGADVLELRLEVAFAEEVVEVVVEAVVDLVYNEDFVDLLDNLLLRAGIDDLEVVGFDLDGLGLLVEGVEAVDEVETIVAVGGEAIYHGTDVLDLALGLDGLGSWEMLV
jgi:succinylarginine dihydrolase